MIRNQMFGLWDVCCMKWRRWNLLFRQRTCRDYIKKLFVGSTKRYPLIIPRTYIILYGRCFRQMQISDQVAVIYAFSSRSNLLNRKYPLKTSSCFATKTNNHSRRRNKARILENHPPPQEHPFSDRLTTQVELCPFKDKGNR